MQQKLEESIEVSFQGEKISFQYYIKNDESYSYFYPYSFPTFQEKEKIGDPIEIFFEKYTLFTKNLKFRLTVHLQVIHLIDNEGGDNSEKTILRAELNEQVIYSLAPDSLAPDSIDRLSDVFRVSDCVKLFQK